MFNLSNLIIAYRLAKLQEEHIGISKKNVKSVPYSMEFEILKKPHSHARILSRMLKKGLMLVQKINQNQIKDHREKGLCYFCYACWNQGHKCQNPTSFLIKELGVQTDSLKNE